MKYAVIHTGGKQYRISEGDIIEVERLSTQPQAPVVFSDVLLSVSDGEVTIGKPYIPGMSVVGQLLENIRGEKIRVAKFKAKARYRRVMGHRQALSKVKITQIGAEKPQKAIAAKTKKSPAKTVKPVQKKAK